MVSVSPLPVHCKELNAVLYSSSHQELSAIFPLYNTDPDPLDDEKEERRREGVEGRRDEWGNYNDSTVYMASELEGEAPKCQVLSSAATTEAAWEGTSPTLLKDPVIVVWKKCTLPRGHASTRVVGLCVDNCQLGNWGEEPIVACLDSGSDLTLLSEAELAKMRNPPKVHLAKGFHLKGVTGETRVKGYVNLCLWL